MFSRFARLNVKSPCFAARATRADQLAHLLPARLRAPQAPSRTKQALGIPPYAPRGCLGCGGVARSSPRGAPHADVCTCNNVNSRATTEGLSDSPHATRHSAWPILIAPGGADARFWPRGGGAGCSSGGGGNAFATPAHAVDALGLPSASEAVGRADSLAGVDAMRVTGFLRPPGWGGPSWGVGT